MVICMPFNTGENAHRLNRMRRLRVPDLGHLDFVELKKKTASVSRRREILKYLNMRRSSVTNRSSFFRFMGLKFFFSKIRNKTTTEENLCSDMLTSSCNPECHYRHIRLAGDIFSLPAQLIHRLDNPRSSIFRNVAATLAGGLHIQA